MDTPVDIFALSPEQQDTAALLERLFGRAIAIRYVDFLKLSSSRTGLRVARPLAAHALRELDSMLRSALEVPMDAKALPTPDGSETLARAEEALRLLGYPENAIRAALERLAPRHNHRWQIQLIAQRLGLAPDGDIAKAWVSLCETFGRAHERSFHRSLAVDDEFRDIYQKPFEMVLRGIVTALQTRYSALMQRVETIAAMSDASVGVTLYEREIPGAMPLQWHFFQSIASPAWLPHLLRRNLIGEPLAPRDDASGRSFREWPVAQYLLRMAKSVDPSVHDQIADALRRVSSSRHPDITQQGIDIIAALPPALAARLVDVAIGWMTPETPHLYSSGPEKLLKSLAEAGCAEAALRVAAAFFQLFDKDGNLGTLHPEHMYEHYLSGAVKLLAPRDPINAVRLFSELLVQAITLTHKLNPDGGDDLTHYTAHPIADDQLEAFGVFEALIIAVRNSALTACTVNPAATANVITDLFARPPRIFKRIALHVLANHADAAQELAKALLADHTVIGETWCEDEYAALSISHFSALAPEAQKQIFDVIDSMPDRYRESWRQRVEESKETRPTAEQERKYNLYVIRDAVWKWRSVLPPDRKAALYAIVAELGDPDSWRNEFFPPEHSPLTGADLSTRPIAEVLVFLRSWKPQAEPVRQTITALGQQLRSATEHDPARFAAVADQFADLRSIYIRRLLEGLDTKARNRDTLSWTKIVALMRSVIERLDRPYDTFARAEGDDVDWQWSAASAAALLKSGLRQGKAGIPYDHAPEILATVEALFEKAPRIPESKDFDTSFDNHPYFTAEQSLWGSAIELCVLFMFWSSKHEGSPVSSQSRAALSLLPAVRHMLDSAIADRTSSGRIPRAILGRYLHWLFHFGEDWLKVRMPLLFPDDDDALRRAAWLGHLLNDQGPLRSLLPQLTRSYWDEIARLGQGTDAIRDQSHREDRLGDYLLFHYLAGVAPVPMMDAFWRQAPARARQHVMSTLGRELQQALEPASADWRARTIAYWEARLTAGSAAADPGPYRQELGAIGQWCIRDGIDADWLLDQLLRLLNAGFAPNNGFSTTDWLAKVAPVHAIKTVAVLSALLTSPHIDHWAYVHREPIRTVLEVGLRTHDDETVVRVQELISYLSSIGETTYLDLLRPAPAAAG